LAKQVDQDVAIPEIMQSLRRIFKAIQDYSRDVTQKYRITGPQLWALNTISKNERMSLSDLSERMYLHRSTITGLMDRLEKKGYVARNRDRVDRRVIYVQLTTEGKRLVKRAPNPIQGKMIYGLRNLEKRKLNLIYESLRELVGIMEVKNVKVTFFFDQE